MDGLSGQVATPLFEAQKHGPEVGFLVSVLTEWLNSIINDSSILNYRFILSYNM